MLEQIVLTFELVRLAWGLIIASVCIPQMAWASGGGLLRQGVRATRHASSLRVARAARLAKPCVLTSPAALPALSIEIEAAARASTAIQSGDGWRSLATDGVILPVGVDRKGFQKLVSSVREADGLEQADAIILYGSRTHHTAGSKPRADSDLDVVIAYGDDVKGIDRFDLNTAANAELEKVGQQLGFQVQEQIPFVGDFAGLFSVQERMGFLSYATAKQELEAWETVMRRAATEGWSSKQIKKAFIEAKRAAGNGTVSKEAVIMLRENPQLSEQVAALHARDYNNIVVVAR